MFLIAKVSQLQVHEAFVEVRQSFSADPVKKHSDFQKATKEQNTGEFDGSGAASLTSGRRSPAL